MMLVLSRKPDQRIQIGDNIIIHVLECRSGKVRLGISAPLDLPISRPDAKSHEPKIRDPKPE